MTGRLDADDLISANGRKTEVYPRRLASLVASRRFRESSKLAGQR